MKSRTLRRDQTNPLAVSRSRGKNGAGKGTPSADNLAQHEERIGREWGLSLCLSVAGAAARAEARKVLTLDPTFIIERVAIKRSPFRAPAVRQVKRP